MMITAKISMTKNT